MAVDRDYILRKAFVPITICSAVVAHLDLYFTFSNTEAVLHIFKKAR